MKILRDAGLVTSERRGTGVYYRLAADAKEHTRMRKHLNLATRDLDASVAFYSTLLAATPAKAPPDYALFITEHPGLELAIDLGNASRDLTP